MLRTSQEELNVVKAAMNTEKKARNFKRYQALYLLLSGRTCREVAEIVGIIKDTVANIHKRYKGEDLKGIPDKPIAGWPPRLNAEQRAELKSVILNKLPCEVGSPTEFNWIADLVAKYIKREYGYDYSIRGITGMLDIMNLSYARPTYVLAKADKQNQQQFKQDFDNVKKTFGKHRGVKLVGYLNYETGEFYCEEHKTYDAKLFLEFLKNVLSKNKNRKTVMILDNALIHHAKLLQLSLDENEERLQLM